MGGNLTELSKIIIKLSRRWGSGVGAGAGAASGAGSGAQARIDLRRHLGFLDLTRVPELARGFVSVSHTLDLGGYAIGPRPLGFDLELVSRVSPKVVARVSPWARELTLSPSAAHLWCAKEATFKALYHFKQPKVLSELAIEWQGADRFQLSNCAEFGIKSGRGKIFTRGPHLLAVYEVGT